MHALRHALRTPLIEYRIYSGAEDVRYCLPKAPELLVLGKNRKCRPRHVLRQCGVRGRCCHGYGDVVEDAEVQM